MQRKAKAVNTYILQEKGISVGKGASRYSRPERIDFEGVESMLRGTLESTGPVF